MSDEIKNIAIVANKPARLLTTDFSSEIENCDLVVRVSKMCNYDSGLVGKRTDVLYLEPNALFHSVVTEQQMDRITNTPTIYIRPMMANMWPHHKQIMELDLMVAHKFTTAMMAVYHTAKLYPDAKIHLFAMDIGENRKRLLGGFHHESREVIILDNMIKQGIIEYHE